MEIWAFWNWKEKDKEKGTRVKIEIKKKKGGQKLSGKGEEEGKWNKVEWGENSI